jgi:hypothetical protein
MKRRTPPDAIGAARPSFLYQIAQARENTLDLK